MASAVLHISWNHPYPGMSKQAFGLLSTEVGAYLRSLQGKWCERMEICALTPHGEGIHGFVLLFGERAKLDELRRTDEFEAFVMKMGEVFSGLGVVPGLNFDGIQAVMERRKKSGVD